MKEIDDSELSCRISIIMDSEGILPQYSEFYMLSILYSAERSVLAFDRYENLLLSSRDSSLLISSVQEAIGHAASLSRYFWCSGQANKNKEMFRLRNIRAQNLRKKFEIKDSSPLKDRALRDAWEHFDERLDSFLIINDSGYFFPTPILEKHTIADEPMANIFKLLDIEAQCLVLLNQKYYFGEIKDEALKIYKIACSLVK